MVQVSERRDERPVLAVLGVAALAYSLMQALVIPVLPAIQHELHRSADAASWTLTGFLLSSSVATPIAGRFGDMLGKRRVLVAVLLIVAAGSLLCVVPTFEALVAGRVVQGVGGGVLPLAYAIVRDEIADARVSGGIALMASLLGVGGGLGVVGSGVLVEHVSYTWIFALQVPLFLAVAWAARRWVPESPTTAPGRIDWTGAILVSCGLVVLLLTLTQARVWGLGSTATLGGVMVAGVFLLAWAWSALRRSEPLLDLRMLRRRPVWTTNAVAFAVGIGQFAGLLLLSQYVQEPASTGYGFGASPLQAGVFLLPLTAGFLLVGFVAGPLERRFGGRILLVGGNLVTAAGFVLLTFERSGPLEVYAASALLGIGTGVAMAALGTLIVSNVAQRETGAAAGANNVARALGGAVGAQLAAALLAAATAAGDGVREAAAYTPAFAVGLGAVTIAVLLGPLLPRQAGAPRGA
jgi:MFS family permease